ncbi:unnamed protein product [Orchesella dallaii]|uniref:Glucose-methanol-choline oxidoreductase N-terminal domain-containing protein n=1 Tax=Orchesella dallaii TaxID=48710 RepID=A0ABP1PQS8_9HEXA
MRTATPWIRILDFLVVNLSTIYMINYYMELQMDQVKMRYESAQDTFDFVIVGAGSAGCVLANKLSEKHSVLLLEAGGDHHQPLINAPVMFFNNQNRFPHDWQYQTVPQSNSSFAFKNNVTLWPAGKGLGGSGLINGMIYIRGSVQGFDDVAERTSNPIWTMRNAQKHYKQLEDYHGHFDQKNHGVGGGMTIEKGDIRPVIDNVMKAGEELGYKVRDPNLDGPITEGFAPMDFHMKNGYRWDSYKAYIEPILDRPTLTVRKFAFVNKVLIAGETNKAFGVEYERHGQTKIAKASKEVILSAGAIQSPRILMHSGIGPKTHLEEFGIKPVLDLPVGENLQDKYGAFVGPFFVDEGKSFLMERELTMSAMVEFGVFGTSPYASTRLEGTYTFRSSKAKTEGYKYPDIFTYIMVHSTDSEYERDMEVAANTKKEILRGYYKMWAGNDSFFQLVTLPKPYSKGFLKLRDADPKSPPILDPKYLSHQRDVDLLVEGIKFAVNLVEETKSFKEIHGKMLPVPFPGCEKLPFKSDAYWECVARHTTATAYKYCATVPMGKDTNDPAAVVDSFLRVFGTKGLRVVDGSVFQEKEVSVNQCTCQMLGSVASEFILDYWDNQASGLDNSLEDEK